VVTSSGLEIHAFLLGDNMQVQRLSGIVRATFTPWQKRSGGKKPLLERVQKPVIETLEARQMLSFSAGTTGTGITPTILSSTVPASIVAGAKFHGTLKLDLTDSLTTTETGYTVRVYASTSTTLDTTTDPLVTSVVKTSSIKSAKTVPLTIPITTLPSTLPDGSYYLIAQTTDSAGNTDSAATGSTVTVAAAHIALSETVTPPFTSALVGGAAAKGSVKVKITNNGNEISTGTTAIDLSFSTTPGVPGTSFATLNKRLSIPVGKSVTVAIPVKTIPVVPDGSYYVIASVSNPDGGVTVGSSPSTTLIATPFITLGATVSNITNVKAGVTVVVTNSGNSVDSTRLTGTFGLASDSQGLDAVGGTATITSAKVNIQPGKSIKVHIKPSRAFISTLVPGTEYT